jgi:hypothetical protein
VRVDFLCVRADLACSSANSYRTELSDWFSFVA